MPVIPAFFRKGEGEYLLSILAPLMEAGERIKVRGDLNA
jgi:hypothetical protein